MITPIYSSASEITVVALGGIIGALVKDTLTDGCLELPFVKDNKLFLGFIGGAVIGAFIGIVIDGSFITAALGGYTGSSVLTHLVLGSTSKVRFLKNLKLDKEIKVNQTVNSQK